MAVGQGCKRVADVSGWISGGGVSPIDDPYQRSLVGQDVWGTQVEVSPNWDTSYCAKKSEQDVAVKVLRRTSPKINANWFPEGVTVNVVFLLEVTPESKLGRVAYFPSDTDARLVKAVTTSLRQWRFKAASYQGQPISTCLEQPYELIFPALDKK